MSIKVDRGKKKCANVRQVAPIEKPVKFGELNQLIKQTHHSLVDGVSQFQYQSAAIKSIDKTLIQNRKDLNMVDAFIQECNRKLDIIEAQLNQNNVELNAVDAKINWLERYMPLVDVLKLLPKNNRLDFLQKMQTMDTHLMHLKNQDAELSTLIERSFLPPQKNPLVLHLIASHCNVLENVLTLLLRLESKMKTTQTVFENISLRL